MKRSIYTIMFVCVAMLLASCSSEDEQARTPVATIDIDKTTLVTNESMELHFTGVADQVVVFTGDEGHVYQEFGHGDIKENTGIVVNKGLFTYSYAVPGVFHVVVVASTYNTYSGNGQKQAKYEFDITVKDDVNTIDNISFQSQAHNVFYAQQANDHDWVFCIPTMEVYGNKNVKTNVTKRPLIFDIASDSAKVFIDDVEYSSRSTYNLEDKHAIKVISHEGNVREYTLWSLRYPEFSSISFGGANGELIRDAFNQDIITYKFTGVAGTDTMAESHEDNVQFLVNGGVPTSPIDYADTDNVYTLVRTSAENENIKAVTRIKFVFE